jgi:hypothetical protein
MPIAVNKNLVNAMSITPPNCVKYFALGHATPHTIILQTKAGNKISFLDKDMRQK